MSQETSKASFPVVLASDQSAIPVTGTGTNQVTTSGTISAGSGVTGVLSQLTPNVLGAVVATGTTPPAVTVSGTPTVSVTELQVDILIGGLRGVATFQWSQDGGQTFTGPVTTAASVALAGTGLTVNFPAGTYNADNLYTADVLAPGSFILLALTGQECLTVGMIRGTWTAGGTMYVDVSPDGGINWITKSIYTQGGGLGGVMDVLTFVTAVKSLGRVDVAGMSYCRIRGSGTITVSGGITPTFFMLAFRGTPLERVVTPAPCSTSTSTNIPANAANVTLLAANAARLGATIFNNALSGNLYLKYGAVATVTTACHAKIPPGGYWELPFRYTGQVDGIWDTADGNGANVAEFTV